jgi:hypothetical protein
MGILNPKTRIVDIAMTPFGRAALAKDGLNISYASFTDGQTYYDPASISGSSDSASDRIFLEAPASLPQDLLAFVTDDSGNLIPAQVFGEGSSYSYFGDEDIYSGLTNLNGIENAAEFSSAVTAISEYFQRSFSYNTIIGTSSPLDNSPEFVLFPTTASFYIKNDMSSSFELVKLVETEEGDPSAGPVVSINTADSLFFDKRFANLPQFKFMPPVSSIGSNQTQIGRYENLKSFNRYPYSSLRDDVLGTDSKPIKQRVDIEIEDTSSTNDVVLQMFEINNNGVTKLDAVDYGEVTDLSDSQRPSKRIIFFGKVFTDDYQSSTFINLFTVVLD